MKRLRLHKESGKIGYDYPVDKRIHGWLKTESDPKTFGQIRKFLKEQKIAYKNMDKNRATLSETLRRLIEQNHIEKIPPDKNNVYPRYAAVGKSNFNSAFDGYAFKSELLMMFFGPVSYNELDYDLEKLLRKKIDDDKKKILNLISLFGIYVLFTLLSSYKRPILKKYSKKENFANREIWLLNALDFEISPQSNRPSRHLSTKLLRGFLKSDEIHRIKYDPTKGLEDYLTDPLILEQVEYAKILMKKLFPTTMKWLNKESKSKLLSNDLRDTFRKDQKLLSRLRESMP